MLQINPVCVKELSFFLISAKELEPQTAAAFVLLLLQKKASNKELFT